MTTSKKTGTLTDTGLLVILILAVILTWGLRKTEVLAANIEKPDPKRILAIFLFKQGLSWAYRVEESMRLALASKSAFPFNFLSYYPYLCRLCGCK